MSNITQASHFNGLLRLPNIGTAGIDYDLLNDYISKYEAIFLSSIFGYSMYQEFIENYDETDSPYYDLKNGAEYEDVAGNIQNWSGFVSGSNPIANYVYTKFIAEQSIIITSVGAVSNQAENATRVSINAKLVYAWNEMVRFNCRLHDYLFANRDDFPDYVGFVYAPNVQGVPLSDNQILFKYTNTLGL